jgi:outer membrane protein insertion porin family
MMIRLLIPLLVWLPLASGQVRQKQPAAKSKPSQPAPSGYVIESLTIEGNSNYTREQILAVLGLKVGQVAGEPEFEAARQRLLATGAFGTVGYKFGPSPGGGGYAASFQVVEVAQVFPYRFERLDAPTSALEDALRRVDPLFGPKIVANQPVLDRYTRAIEAFLASKGTKETVVAKAISDESEHMVIVFSPVTPPPSVAEVKFVNNKIIPAKSLQNAIAPVAVGAVYSEALFRRFLDASIRPLYEERGRIRVSFPKVETQPSRDVNGLTVTVEVVEGDSFQLGDVRFEGQALPVEQLRKAGDFKTGDVANFTQIQAGVERLETVLKRQGYMHPHTTVERKLQEQKKVVDLVMHVDQGAQYHFGTLKLQGLDINSEAEIRRRWGLKEGAPFNVEYPDYFLSRIREDGVFDNLGKTKSTVDVHDQTLTVDVTLFFR